MEKAEKQNLSYELMCIFSPDAGEKQIANELDEIKEIIASGNGKVINEDTWGLRDLAYTIKKHDRGYYVVLNFDMEGARVAEMERHLRLAPLVLRHLIVKNEKNYTFKRLDDYVKEAEEVALKEQKEKEEKEERNSKPVPRKPTPQAPKSEPLTKKSAPDKASQKKLESIIDDPDITL